MVERIEVSVTADDIKHGEINNCYRCPIARALQRCGFERPIVDGVQICLGVGMAEIDTPAEANEFIKRFDDGLPVQPFEFALEIPRG